MSKVLAFNIINALAIILSGTFFIIKAIDHLKSEKIANEGESTEDISSEVLFDQLNIMRKKFWRSFLILEISLITFFIYWSVMFYKNVKII